MRAPLSLPLILSALFPFLSAAPVPQASTEPVDVLGSADGGYIVMLEPDVMPSDIFGALELPAAVSGLTYTYDAIFNGFSGNFNPAIVEALRGAPGVTAIVEDSVMRTTAIQTDAPWGLGRVSSKTRLEGQDDQVSFTYKYDDRAGEGVDIYVLDTGIRTSHRDFGGRAQWGATFVIGKGMVMGTEHTARTAAGGRYGVAKKAQVIGVKVLNDLGSGSVSDIVKGMEWVLKRVNGSGKPSVVSMSLGGGGNDALDAAARKLVQEGIHVVVAAGNDNTNASDYSPARVEQAITVGATTISDERATFSNHGGLVDVFAPGVNVVSAWKDSDTSIKSISGTSMATPHVAGLVAYIISTQGNMDPAAMRNTIRAMSLVDVINPTTIPSGTTNLLINNQFDN